MKKISLIVHQEYIEDTVKAFHEAGIVEIVDISKEEPKLLEEVEKAEMHPEAATCTNYELRLTRLIDILNKTQKHPTGIKAILGPKLPEIKTVEEHSLDELYSYIEGILNEIEKNILAYEDKIKELDEQEEKIKRTLEQLNYLLDFKLDISDIGESEYLFIVAGKTNDLADIKKEIKSIDTAVMYSKQFGTSKKPEWAVVIVGHISEREKIEKLCREKIALFDFENLKGSPNDVVKTLETEKKKIEDERNEILTALEDYESKNLNELLATREEIRLERVRKEISKDFAKTDTTYIIKGWILEKNEEDLKSLIKNVSKDLVIYNSETPSMNPDNPPTYFETPRWAASFRTFLELFATPKYNELNPTIFMGIFFILFFALMLGDAGYGLIIFILSLIGYLKYGKHSSMIKTWAFLGIWLGLSTTIAGILMNSFFGDLIPRFIYGNPEQPLYSLSLGFINLPLDPIREPLTILTIALICGIIHLNLGIILAIIQSFHRRDFKTLFTKHFCWIPMQIGGGILIGNFIMGWEVAGVLFYIAAILTLIGVILLFIGAGPIGFFGITGYVGDWLSYARLLALGLATAGMALAFNVVSGMLQPTKIDGIIPVILVILMIVLLSILHIVNLGLQALGAGVHSLRLQYVEFFNRFYEGGGRKFSPFKIIRRYTKIEEKID